MSLPTDVSRRLQQIQRSPGRPISLQLWFPLLVYIVTRLITVAYLVAAASASVGVRKPGDRLGRWPLLETETRRSERRFHVIFIAALVILSLGLQWVWVSCFLALAPPSARYP